MDRKFVCNQCVCEEVPEEEYIMVGFANSDDADPDEYVILQLGLSFDEQDVALGMDTYYMEYVSDAAELSGYGICTSVEAGPGEVVFRFRPNEEGLDTLTVDLSNCRHEYDAPAFRTMLDRILCGVPR